MEFVPIDARQMVPAAQERDSIPAVDRTRRVHRADVCVAVLAAAAVLLLLAVGMDRSFWLDEANPALWCAQSFHGLIDSLSRDNSLPVYYVLLALWMRLCGDSEVALRSLSFLCYLAAACATAALVWTLWRDRRAAFYAAIFYLASAQAFRQAQIARMYSMLGLLGALSLLLYVRGFVESNRREKHVALWALVNSIGVLTQVWFFFVLFGQFAHQFLGLRRDRWKFLGWMLPPALAFAGLWGPIFLVQIHNGSTAWLPPMRPWFAVDAVIQFYGGDGIAVAFLALCAAPILLAEEASRGAFQCECGTRVLGTVFAVCLATPLAISIWKPIYWPGRYTIVALPALAGLLGAAITRRAPHGYAPAMACGMLLVAMFWHVRHRDTVGDDPRPGLSDRAAAEYIVRHAAPGDAVVFTSLARPPADYYFHRLGAAGRFVESSFPAELDRHPGWPENPRMLDAAALDAEALRLVALRPSGRHLWVYYGYDLEVARHLKQKLDAGMTLLAEVRLPGPFHQKLLEYRGS